MKVAVIGGGAAGFFAAMAVKENFPSARVIIFEKSQKLLAKVKVSGGGRCNVTNACTSISELSRAYPRGGKQMKKALAVFNTRHTIEWFESRGVPLYAQDDGRVFPKTNKSQTIIDLFLSECERLDIELKLGVGVNAIKVLDNGTVLSFADSALEPQSFNKVIVAVGGSPKRAGFAWLEELGHKIEEPVPSLFTFNMPDETITELMGVVAENALVNIQGTKLRAQGPLLITHWGMSGPAILKLSAFGARALRKMNYDFKVQVNWVGEVNNEVVMEQLLNLADEHPNKLLSNEKPFPLPERLWQYLLWRSGMPSKKVWGEMGRKVLNRLVNTLCNDISVVKGKTTFKEEFVTCGGVNLESVDIKTMESKVCKNLYFAGEILDIDGITGGYNFQAAWTTAYLAGKLS